MKPIEINSLMMIAIKAVSMAKLKEELDRVLFKEEDQRALVVDVKIFRRENVYEALIFIDINEG